MPGDHHVSEVEHHRWHAPDTTFGGLSATLGIDLASQPENTAACLIDWSGAGASVQTLWHGIDADGRPLTDAILLALCLGRPVKIGIDAPLGWPRDFVAAIADLDAWPLGLDASRVGLQRRATDDWIHSVTGKYALSVSTDRIAYPAMRAAAIVAEFQRRSGARVDRSGATGPICEAYPSPSIRALGLWPAAVPVRQSYKASAVDVRAAIVETLSLEAPWLSIADADRERLIAGDDCLDALICALIARAASVGVTHPIPDDARERATVEGWIQLPSAPVGALLSHSEDTPTV